MIFVRRDPTTLLHPFFLEPDIDRYVFPQLSEDKPTAENRVVSKSNEGDEQVIRYGRNVNVVENEDAWILYMDIPGVKSDNVEIEENEGTLTVNAVRKNAEKVTAKYHQTFALDPRTMNIGELSTSLSDGVLTITVPKKPASEPVSVEVLATDAPEVAEDESKEFRYTLDLPGVKAGDIKVEFRDETLYLEAERKKGNFTSKVQRMFTVGHTVDKEHAKAYLIDGILTLVAPKEESTKSESRKIALGNSAAIKPEKEEPNSN